MRGRADALKQDRERVLFGAWAGAMFTRQDKLKGFSHYAKEMLPRDPQTNAGKLAALRNVQASGVPMTIKRIA